MAKKKRFGKKSRRFGMVSKRRSRRSSSAGLSLGRLAVGALIYGAGRAPLNNAIKPLTQFLPLGNIADEVALIGVAYMAHKMVKNPMVRDVARSAITIEFARIGEAVISGQVSLGNLTQSSAIPAGLF